ncbi:MAG: ATP-binding protein [Verrucomicrobiota bacterium]
MHQQREALRPMEMNSENESFFKKYLYPLLIIALLSIIGVGLYFENTSLVRQIENLQKLSQICSQQISLLHQIQADLSIVQPSPLENNSDSTLTSSIDLKTPTLHLVPRSEEARLAWEQMEKNNSILEQGGEHATQPLPPRIRGESLTTIFTLQKNLHEQFTPLLKTPIETSLEESLRLLNQSHENRLKLKNEIETLNARISTEIETLRNQSTLVHQGAFGAFLLSALVGLGTFFTMVRRSTDHAQHVFLQLKDSNEALTKTSSALRQYKLETELIFKTIRQGLFLMNRDFQIGSNHTEELISIFQTKELTGMTLTGVLQRILSEKMYRTCCDYLEMLFDSSKRERTLVKINPLDEIEVHFPDGSGGFQTKFLCFNFNRVVSDQNEIHQVFVSVRDITEQIQLTRQLQASEKRKERQFLLLMGILHVKSEDLQKFTEQTLQEIDQINAEMKAENLSGVTLGIAQDAMLRQRMNGTFRKVHAIKGNATYLGLDYFVHITNEIEDRINELKNTPRLSGEDFLGLVLQVSELKNALHEIEDLKIRLLSLREAKLGHPVVESSVTLEAGLENLCRTLSRQTDKIAKIELSGFHSDAIPAHRTEIIKQTLIQFIRNSFSHGIEATTERESKGKDPTASISVLGHYDSAQRSYHLVYRDDGKGFDTDLIRRACLNHGFLTMQEAQSVSDDEIIPYIFKPQVTTTPEADQLSGRGVGLDLVHHQIVNELGGTIQTAHQKEAFCEFRVTIPC